MFFPYFVDHGAGIVEAKRNSDGTWFVRGRIDDSSMNDEVFRQMFSKEPQYGFRRRGHHGKVDFDLHAPLAAGTHEAQILESREQIKAYSETHATAEYLNVQGHIVQVSDYPWMRGGSHDPAVHFMDESREMWHLPWIAISEK